MMKVFFMDRMIGRISAAHYEVLTELLPYWGLKVGQHPSILLPGLSGKSVCVIGLDDARMKELAAVLSHTGARLVTETEAAELVFICSFSNSEAPIVLNANNLTYSLKVQRTEHHDLQRFIHKNIWLPIQMENYHIEFSKLHTSYVAEYLFYLIVQHFTQQEFTTIKSIDFQTFYKLVHTILTPINFKFHFAQTASRKEWPAQPALLRQTFLPKEAPSPQKLAFNPFKAAHPAEDKQVIAPFHKTNHHRNTAIIQPFHKN